MIEACCKRMTFDLNRQCDRHATRFECPDALIYIAEDGSLGLIVHDGGRSFVPIAFCPWCGTQLVDELETDDDPD